MYRKSAAKSRHKISLRRRFAQYAVAPFVWLTRCNLFSLRARTCRALNTFRSNSQGFKVLLLYKISMCILNLFTWAKRSCSGAVSSLPLYCIKTILLNILIHIRSAISVWLSNFTILRLSKPKDKEASYLQLNQIKEYDFQNPLCGMVP